MKSLTKLAVRLLIVMCLPLYISSCNVTLVQPYDAELYKNTENFYKKASTVIARGMSVSPKTSNEVRSISDATKEQHPGHYKQFKRDYDALLVENNALILRSLANSDQIDKMGKKLQAKIEAAIEKKLPGDCDSLQSSFVGVSLTTRNFIDLKCVIGRWNDVHQGKGSNNDSTYGKQILKQANWEGRSKTLFDAILAIQKAEATKKDE